MTFWNHSLKPGCTYFGTALHLLTPNPIRLSRGICDPGEEVWAALGGGHHELSSQLLCEQLAVVHLRRRGGLDLRGALFQPRAEGGGFLHFNWLLNPLDDLGHSSEEDLVGMGLLDPVNPEEEGVKELWVVFQPGSMES